MAIEENTKRFQEQAVLVRWLVAASLVGKHNQTTNLKLPKQNIVGICF